MANKVDMAAAMAAFLARGGKVQACPAGEANATPLRTLRAQAEKRWQETGEYRVLTPAQEAQERADDLADRRERAAEAYFEAGVQARLCGASRSEALDTARYASNRVMWGEDD